MDKFALTNENYDGVVSALLGNGELCTTVGPTCFHTPPDQQTDIAHKTQHFILAGRRKSGPQHPLINFGTLSRTVFVDGVESVPRSWSQQIRDVLPFVAERYRHDWRTFWVFSEVTHDHFGEFSTSGVSLNQNAYINNFSLSRQVESPVAIDFQVMYQIGEPAAILDVSEHSGIIRIAYSVEDHLGDIWFGCCETVPEHATVELDLLDKGGRFRVKFDLSKFAQPTLDTWIQFSDRKTYEDPILVGLGQYTGSEMAIVSAGNRQAAQRFWDVSEIVTGDEVVDRFRIMSLYTLRSQATPWSVPPTVSQEYWGAGTFHDEMYPFLGLLANNHVELAERIPYFRLTTLPQAMQRARGRGALYPWSSTEYGEERDPNGLWLTERFHLGQFAVCIWMLWLYNRDPVQLDDLYPVLREIARYFELNMLEHDKEGRLRTKACCDFDESVGEVTNGPFTICAAIASMEYAANAAEILGKDPLRIPRWRELAHELRLNLPTTERPSTSSRQSEDRGPTTEHRFAVPDDKPLHYSILSPIFPFRIDVNSPTARASAEYIHKVCRSTKGWKPGFSEVFEGSNWMWTAGHLGIVHALQGNGDLAWEAIKAAPESAGPFLSPNEHVDKDGVIHVPWFTTGCGGWLYALACLFVQVDESGTKLLPAVPKALPNARFRDLRADRGVLVSGEFKDGMLSSLIARAPAVMTWQYHIPDTYLTNRKVIGQVIGQKGGWTTVEIELAPEPVTLLVQA